MTGGASVVQSAITEETHPADIRLGASARGVVVATSTGANLNSRE